MDDRPAPVAPDGPASRTTSRASSYAFVCDEWPATAGGISSVNRALATAVAARGHRSVCLVADATDNDRRDAARFGVRLLSAERTPAGPDLHLPVPELLADPPDVVVGHDRITGHVAWVHARMCPGSRLVHLVHTAPAEIEPYKGRMDAALRTEARESFTLDMARHADVVAAVGPRLTRYVTHLLDDGFGGPAVLRLDPGLDVDDHDDRERRPPVRAHMMILGRTGDTALKGLDIAAGAIAVLPPRTNQPPPVLFVRGAEAAECERLRAALVAQTGLARRQVDVRPFRADADAVRRDLRRAALCLMPSRAEGFGLVAWEAIAAGTPVLISAQSGAAELLREELGTSAATMVVDVTDDLVHDVQTWSRAVQAVLDDLPAAFAHAHKVRTTLASRLTWSKTVRGLETRIRAGSS